MSVKVMGLVWDHYPEGGGELLTALKLADHADHIGDRIWPGVASLARQTRQSERTVQRHLQAMLDAGWLVRVEAGGKGPAHTTRYRMPIEAIPQGVVGRVTKLHPRSSTERVTPGAKKSDIGDKKGDTAMSPEPSLRQSSRASACGARLPLDWKPTTELQTWAHTERPDLDLRVVVATFADHWRAQPGQRGVKLDWAATFRNWIRKERPAAGARAAGPTLGTKVCARGADCLQPGPMQGHTRMSIGDVCNACRRAYMDGKWRQPQLEARP